MWEAGFSIVTWTPAEHLSVIVKPKADTPCSTFEEITFLHIMRIAKNYDTCDVVVDRYFVGS